MVIYDTEIYLGFTVTHIHLSWSIRVTYSIYQFATTLSNLCTSSLVSPSLSSQSFSDSRELSAYRRQMCVAPVVCTTRYVHTARWQLMVLFVSSIPPSPVALSTFSSVFPPLCSLTGFVSVFPFCQSHLRGWPWSALPWQLNGKKRPKPQCLPTDKFFNPTLTFRLTCQKYNLTTRLYFVVWYSIMLGLTEVNEAISGH